MLAIPSDGHCWFCFEVIPAGMASCGACWRELRGGRLEREVELCDDERERRRGTQVRLI